MKTPLSLLHPEGNTPATLVCSIPAMEPTNGQLLEVLLDFRDAVGARFDAVDRRFYTIEAKLVEHDRRFDAIDQKLAEHDRRFDEHDRRFDVLERRMGRLETRIEHLENRISA